MLYHHSPFCKSIPKTLHSILWSGLGTLLLQKYILLLLQWSSRWSTRCKRRSKPPMLLQIQKVLHKSWADMLDQVLWRRTWWNIRNTNTCTCKKDQLLLRIYWSYHSQGILSSNSIHKICYKYHSISTTHSQKSKSKRIQRQTVNKAIVITSTSTDITSNAHRFRLYPFSSL